MKRFRGSDRAYLIVAVICFLLLAVLSVYNSEGEKPDMNDFAGNYYIGEYIRQSDSKSIYAALEGYGTVGSTSCIVMPKTLDPTLTISPLNQSLPWIASSEATTQEEANDLADKTGYIQPYDDGDYIIAPGELTFTNSNVSSNATDICIYATIGNNYRISFTHIKEWWCHMDCTEEDYDHSTIVGAGSTNGTDTVLAGTIIGKATSATQVLIEKTEDGRNWVQTSFADYYNR